MLVTDELAYLGVQDKLSLLIPSRLLTSRFVSTSTKVLTCRLIDKARKGINAASVSNRSKRYDRYAYRCSSDQATVVAMVDGGKVKIVIDTTISQFH